MRTLSFLYVTLFMVFVYLGYSNSIAGTRAYQEARVLVTHTVLADNNGRYSLDYVCDDRIRMSFDVDSNRLQASTTAFRDTTASRMFEFKFEHGPAVLAAMGGAGGAWKVKDLFSVRGMQRRGVNAVIAGIAAAASGYSVGSMLARLGNPSCTETEDLFQAAGRPLERFALAYLMDAAVDRQALVPLEMDPRSGDFRSALAALERSSVIARRNGASFTRYDFLRTTADEFAGRDRTFAFWIFWFPLILFTAALAMVAWVIWDEFIPFVLDVAAVVLGKRGSGTSAGH